jgi:hypothetical protein
MDQQMNIATFQDLMKSKNEGNALIFALQKLAEVKDPKAMTAVKGPQPLGSWSGGGWAWVQ